MKEFPRLAYRSRQLRLALQRPAAVATDQLSPHLSPGGLTLFRRLQASEQAHAWLVLQRLQASGAVDPDLLAAALLHDIGKVIAPLSTWERVLIVLGRRFFPRLAERMGRGQPRGLRRAFVVALRHPEWGAELAAEAGATARTLDLVRRHQEAAVGGDPLLAALRQADDEA